MEGGDEPGAPDRPNPTGGDGGGAGGTESEVTGEGQGQPGGEGVAFPQVAPSPRPAVPKALEQAAAISWRILVVLAALTIAVMVLVRLRVLVLPIIVSIFAATVLVPGARWLRRRGWPPLAATAAVMVGAFAVTAGVGYLIATSVANELADVGDRVSQGLDDIERWLAEGPLDLSEDDLRRWRERIRTEVSQNSSALTQGAVRAGALAIELVAGLLLSIVVTFFIVKDGDRFGPWFTGLFPRRHTSDLQALGTKAWGTLVGYLRGVAVTGLVDGVLIGIGLAVLGVPLVLPLATLTFVGAFLPLVGATAAGVVAALVALVTKGLVTALIVVGLTVVIQQVEGDVLAPLVLGRAVRLHPLTILFALTGGTVIAGIAGAFLAVPLTAVVKTAIDHYRPRYTEEPALPPSRPAA